jgi:hypothetical protein
VATAPVVVPPASSAPSANPTFGGSYGFGARLKNAVAAFAGAIFSPQIPPAPSPQTQAEGGRQWQYRPGYNLVYTPRAAEDLTPFGWMRNVADIHDMTRICIQYRSEEIAGLDWSIVPLDETNPPSDAQLSDARARLEKPDGYHRWDAWIKMAFEEVLTLDALSIYPQRNRRGDIMTLDLIAGDTVRPLINGTGRTPPPPAPAFQHILYGRPWWEGTVDDLIYAPMRPRVNSAYGRSPVEEFIITVNRSLARQTFDWSWYKDGNIPDALVPAPAEMGQEQLEVLQDWFDNVVNMPGNRRKLHFIPSSTGRLNSVFFKQPVDDTAVEEFLDMRIMAALGVEPQEIGFTSKVNKSTAQLQENAQIRRRVPAIRFLSGLMTDLLHRMGDPDVAIQFTGDRPEEDKLAQAQVDEIYIKSGVIGPEEVRERQNLGVSAAPRFIIVGNSLAMLPSVGQSIPTAESQEDEELRLNNPEEAEEVPASPTAAAAGTPVFLTAPAPPSGMVSAPNGAPTAPKPAPASSPVHDAAAAAKGSESNVQRRAYDRAAALRELQRFETFSAKPWRVTRGRPFAFEQIPASLRPFLTGDVIEDARPADPSGFVRMVLRADSGGKGDEAALLDYWKGQMGESGDFDECVAKLEGKKDIEDPKALCAWLHMQSTGAPPGHAPGEAEDKATRASYLTLVDRVLAQRPEGIAAERWEAAVLEQMTRVRRVPLRTVPGTDKREPSSR